MLEIGEVRPCMEGVHANRIQKIMDTPKFQKLKSYYIFVHANWTNNQLNHMKTTYMVRSTKPLEMLGTELYFVDNVKSTIQKIWDLPLDVLVPSECLNPDAFVPLVAQSATKVKPNIILS